MAQKQRAAAKKVKDKWRAKEWYKIYAPEMFSNMQLGDTPADSADGVLGRITEATVQDLTGDFSKMHIKIKFKVHDVRGLDAHTMFFGHDLTSDYVRRLTRRKRTKTDAVVDVVTKDGWEIRVKPMAVSEQRIQASQETGVRAIMGEEVKKAASGVTIGEFVRMLIMGELSKRISDASKVIVPIKKIEIRRSEVTKMGRPPQPGESPVMGPQEPEPEPEPEPPAAEVQAPPTEPAPPAPEPVEAPAPEEAPAEEEKQE
ncbi:MAG: 30S ribosomal protein S3ae [Candidatus Thermoplasmatota archaeon]|nr:30S ribosomal protein S3ae [Candidatus Thermoplasmatota archaeon]